MPTFRDTEHLYQILGGLFDKLKCDPQIGPQLRATNMTMRFNYKNPDAAIWVDAASDPATPGAHVEWRRDDGGAKPDVEMWMTADVAHRFWLGKVSLLVALMKRDIVAKGPIPKIMKVLPVLTPAYAMYQEFLRERGEHQLLAVK